MISNSSILTSFAELIDDRSVPSDTYKSSSNLRAELLEDGTFRILVCTSAPQEFYLHVPMFLNDALGLSYDSI